MSIDAIINEVIEDGDNIILDLMAREVGGHRGQPKLTIINFTHRPRVGQEIWGGGGGVIIEPGYGIEEQKRYRRIMYTRLEEDFARGGTVENER